jgi:hypothetical protein
MVRATRTKAPCHAPLLCLVVVAIHSALCRGACGALCSDWECAGEEERREEEECEHLSSHSDWYSGSQPPEAAAAAEEEQEEARLSWPLHVPAPVLEQLRGSWEAEGTDIFGGSQGDSLMAIKASRRRSPVSEPRGCVANVHSGDGGEVLLPPRTSASP